MALNAKAFGLAGAVLWGLVMFVMTLLAAGTGYGIGFIYAMSTIYPGLQPVGLEAPLALVYGLIDGFIGCFIFAWLYNKIEAKCPAK